ncbi:Organic cation transporter protein [Nymphon striatum]|nr:Organic cation transporter protein [Nymphon striatum]
MHTSLSKILNLIRMETCLEELVEKKTGWWQKLAMIGLGIVTFLIPGQHLSMPFYAPQVDHWCSKPTDFQNLSTNLWRNYSLPTGKSTEGKMTYSSCKMFDIDYENVSVADYVSFMANLKDQNKTISVKSCSSWSYNKSEWKETIVFDWNLVCDRSYLVSVTSSVYMAGMAVGLLFIPQLSDRYGRKTSNTRMFAILVNQWPFPHFLPKLYSVYGNTFHNGHGRYKLYNYCIRVRIIPESTRWQISIGHYTNAIKSLKVCAKLNGYQLPNDEALLHEAEKIKVILANTQYFNVKEGKDKMECDKKKEATLLDLFKTPKIRMRTLVSYLLWFTVSFCYFAFTLNIDDIAGSIFTNMIISYALEFVGLFIASILMLKIGRRLPTTFLMIFAGTTILLSIAIPTRLTWLKVGFSLTGRTSVSMVFTIMYLHTTEYMPTAARAIGLGSSSMFARLGSIASPYAHQIKEVTSEAVVFVIYGVMCIICGIAVLKLPETRHHPLQQSIEDAENYDYKTKRENPWKGRENINDLVGTFNRVDGCK